MALHSRVWLFLALARRELRQFLDEVGPKRHGENSSRVLQLLLDMPCVSFPT